MKLREIILGIAVMILTIFVVVYGVSIFYPIVKYNDYCEEFKSAQIIDTFEECEKVGGNWIFYEDIKPVEGRDINGFCERNYSCNEEYKEAQEDRSKMIFFIVLPLGILLLILGGFLFGLESVGAGLMGGGIGSILYGAGGYWRYGTDILRFSLSLIGLIAVIYLSYWFNKKFGKK
jgi:hypothetical protein